METELSTVPDGIEKDFCKLKLCDDNPAEINEERLPLVMKCLTPALILEAKTQLNETEENKRKGLFALRKMIEEDGTFTSLTHDLFLLAFLRTRKYDVKKAFKLLQSYWSFRKEHRKILDISVYAPVKELILHSFLGPLEYRDRNGCLVFLVKFGLWDPTVDSYENFFRAVTSILLYAMEHEATQIAGFRLIFDIRGVTWTQLKYATIPNIILIIKSTQFCYPARCKGMHIISASKMFKITWAMIFPFLTSKMKSRMHFHKENLSALKEFIHPSVLPVEFGGDAPTFSNHNWPEIMDSVSANILNQLNYGYKD